MQAEKTTLFQISCLCGSQHQVTGDYSHMNENNYEKWLEEKLILNISPNSVIVSNDASYLNILVEKTPTNVTKRQIMEWLAERLIALQRKYYC
jgi:hypothetical protein